MNNNVRYEIRTSQDMKTGQVMYHPVVMDMANESLLNMMFLTWRIKWHGVGYDAAVPGIDDFYPLKDSDKGEGFKDRAVAEKVARSICDRYLRLQW